MQRGTSGTADCRIDGKHGVVNRDGAAVFRDFIGKRRAPVRFHSERVALPAGGDQPDIDYLMLGKHNRIDCDGLILAEGDICRNCHGITNTTPASESIGVNRIIGKTNQLSEHNSYFVYILYSVVLLLYHWFSRNLYFF